MLADLMYIFSTRVWNIENALHMAVKFINISFPPRLILKKIWLTYINWDLKFIKFLIDFYKILKWILIFVNFFWPKYNKIV